MSSTTIVLIFQSTLPHGSDRWYSILNISHLLFQSTLPHGSDAGHGVTLYYSGISIHAPSRERLRDVREVIHYTQFQSTLPHGSDPLHDIDTVVRGISIHAPLRERQIASIFNHMDNISIHAPLRERNIHHILLTGFLNFNPRSLTGAMEMFAPKIDNDLFQSTLPYGSDIADYFAAGGTAISIHAPLRERLPPRLQEPGRHYFNPRSLTGATQTKRHRLSFFDFNPRSLTGASYKQTLVAYTVGISIHAPLRERLYRLY